MLESQISFLLKRGLKNFNMRFVFFKQFDITSQSFGIRIESLTNLSISRLHM